MLLLRLLADSFTKLFGGRSMPTAAPLPGEAIVGEPAWLKLARADLGIFEFAGPAANPDIMRAWQYCDYQPPNGDETSWCSAKMCEWTECAGLPSTRAPNARSWLKWGHELKVPKFGAITVFWRGSPTSWEGHVAIYLGKGDKPGTIKVLGGNQRNGVTIEDHPERQVLGYRWPVTGGNSRTLRAQTAGAVGDMLTTSSLAMATMPEALAVSSDRQSLASLWPWFGVIGITLSIAARLVTIWARTSDWQAKGV
jgi:uncharacterized protein (TIGR02594 family)